MTHPEIANQILYHKVSSTSSKGMKYLNPRIMAASLKINGHRTILLNIYSPAKTKSKKSQWFANKLCPVTTEVIHNKWDLIIGSDFNATQSPLDKWSSGTNQPHKPIAELETMINTLALHNMW